MSVNAVDLLLLQKDNTWESEEWIVPLSAALANVTAEQAAWAPPGGGNTIWQTVSHINYYNQRILSRLRGIDPGPGVDTNEETFEGSGDARDESNWSNTLAETKRIELELREAIASLSEADLEAPYGTSTETIGRELSRWMLHDAYHAGQIVLIRRQQGSWRS
ncbi:DinB family protein [Paenibacillus macerans]|uniref:DinB family protein n=1 Tax=Paenibacillus macerans TaxID=44252 RepID=UPI00203EEA3D|nr:DinB family protein [Paenibacillus macerans]MCM3698348.1 DinB family protein [Paenibacillus macerans]